MTELEKISINVLQNINYKKLSDTELKNFVSVSKELFTKLLQELNQRESNNHKDNVQIINLRYD